MTVTWWPDLRVPNHNKNTTATTITISSFFQITTCSHHLGSQMSFLPNWTAKGEALMTPSSPSTAITSFAPVRKLLSAETESMTLGRSRMRLAGSIPADCRHLFPLIATLSSSPHGLFNLFQRLCLCVCVCVCCVCVPRSLAADWRMVGNQFRSDRGHPSVTYLDPIPPSAD